MAKRSKRKQSPSKAAQEFEAKTAAANAAPAAPLWLLILQAAVIVAAVFWIFWPVRHGGWLMDDNAYVTQNPGLRDPNGLLNIWFMPGSFVEYYPIEESVIWFIWQFSHDDTYAYHMTNIILHAIGSLLVWRFFSKFGFRWAWLGALLFAVHPAQVESVAWVSELKNTLSLPPFLLCMCFWLDYEEHKRDSDYMIALSLFLIAMLCKITMAPFPFIILLYAWWKRGRVGWGDVWAATPFLVISVVLGITTILVGDWYAPGHVLAIKVPTGDFFSRLACAGVSISFYFTHFFIPFRMLPSYPQWVFNPPTLQQFLPWPIMIGLFCWFWARRRTWGKHVLLGLGFFLLPLGPFVGFHDVSFMRFTWVMDHFLYLPIIGLIGLVLAGLEQFDTRLSILEHRWLIAAISAIIALLTIESHFYAEKFSSLETLWSYEIKYNPEAWLAHNNLGYMLVQTGRVEQAKEQFEEALRIKPDYSEAHNNLGVALSRIGQLAEAEKQYQAALFYNPDYGDARDNLDKLQAYEQHLQQTKQATQPMK